MPAIFDTLALPTDRSAKLLLIHPVTRAPLSDETGEQGWIELYSWESEQAQAHRLARDNAQRKLGREFTAEEEWEDMGQMLARLTKAWHLVGLDGRAIAAPCSFDLAAGAFNATGLRWLRNAAIAFLNVSGNFFPFGWLDALRAHGRHQFWLSQRLKGGGTRRQHLLAAQRQTGRAPAGLVGPPRPPGSEAVWRAFGELDAQRQHSESGIPQPIQHRDVEAWCRTMRVPLHPAEIVAVLALDGERRAVEAERLAARRPRDADLEDDDP